MKCKACEQIKSEEKVYEDDKVVAVLTKNPANFGHILIIPKEHYTIIEQVPDHEMAHIGVVTNKLSIALFESLKIQGTNVFIQNGITAGQIVPHFVVHIIPRIENDGINLDWQPRQLSEEEMSTVELLLHEQADRIGEFEEEKPKPLELDKGKEIDEEIKSDDEENYLIKQLDRIP